MKIEKSRGPRQSRSPFARILRTILWAIVIAFAIGFLVGSLIRRELESPVRYIGARLHRPESPGSPFHASSGLATRPGHIGHALPRVLVTRYHEEQV